MKLLLENKEIGQFLSSLIDHKFACEQIEYTTVNTTEIIPWITERKDNVKFRDKVYDRISQAVNRDTEIYYDKIRELIKTRSKFYDLRLTKHLDTIINKLGEDKVLDAYKKSVETDFVKGTGLSIEPNAEFVRRKNYTDYKEDCLFRNMDGNEEMLLTKMNNNLPFWFIDTGYTNFLNGKRKDWHRLTRNNLHHIKTFDAPVDRLGIFEKFPQQWRQSGEKILIIEPGSFSAKTFKVDIAQWKKSVESELRKHTDRPIVFREKYNKKIRTNLYKHLCDEDYYCVININSNAAVESIWAGIPVITLGTHITNSVSRNQISDINNLYKPHLSNWLCMLSYCQFTYEELINGTAASIAKKYYE